MTATWSMALLGDAGGGVSMSQAWLLVGLPLLALGLVAGGIIGAMSMVSRYNRKSRLPARRLPREREGCRDRRPPLLLFSLPSRWLAVRSSNPHAVQAALGLQQPMPCSWEEGLNAAHEHKLFISPPVGGWILVMGSTLPEPGDDVDRTFRFLVDLSRKLGHVQFFSVSRAVNHHAWAQVEDGTVLRAYAWAGRTLWNQGRLSRAEAELGFKCHGYGEGEERVDYGRPDPAALNTERLPLLAARWSLDPAAIDARRLKQHQGIAGQLSRSQAR